jgi:hypothetical protein
VLASASEGPAHDVVQSCSFNFLLRASKIGLPSTSLDGDHLNSEEEGKLALPLLRGCGRSRRPHVFNSLLVVDLRLNTGTLTSRRGWTWLDGDTVAQPILKM